MPDRKIPLPDERDERRIIRLSAALGFSLGMLVVFTIGLLAISHGCP